MSDQIPSVIYGVKSSPDERESVADQHRIVREAIEREGGREVVGTFGEANQSGYRKERGPQLEAAMAAARAAATEHGEAELWVFHSSRLGRGDGRRGRRSIQKVVSDLLYEDVIVRSATDDEMVTPMLSGIASTVSNKYSEDMSTHIKRGYAQLAASGSPAWLTQGTPLGGYLVTKTFDERGRVVHTAEKHPEDAWIYELVWEMARDGKSDPTIQLALSERGAKRRPTKRNQKLQPFSANMIAGILTNPSYSAQVRHRGTIVGLGKWPAYVSVEDYERIQSERERRAAQTKRPRGRPPGYVTSGMTINPETGERELNLSRPAPFLLSSLATCGECGAAMRGKTIRARLKDGTRIRRYVCSAHDGNHRDSAEFCPAKPIDATVVEQRVVAGIHDLVADSESLASQLGASRVAQIERMGMAAAEARQRAATADRVAERAQTRYEQSLAEDDDEAADINLAAVRRARKEAEAARAELDRALDALNAEPEEHEQDFLARVWKAISGSIADADGDVLKLNAALREWFVAFTLRAPVYAQVKIVPVISAEALARMMRGRVPEGGHYWDHVPAAFRRLSAVDYGPDGEQDRYLGGPLCNTGYSAPPESK